MHDKHRASVNMPRMHALQDSHFVNRAARHSQRHRSDQWLWEALPDCFMQTYWGSRNLSNGLSIPDRHSGATHAATGPTTQPHLNGAIGSAARLVASAAASGVAWRASHAARRAATCSGVNLAASPAPLLLRPRPGPPPPLAALPPSTRGSAPAPSASASASSSGASGYCCAGALSVKP